MRRPALKFLLLAALLPPGQVAAAPSAVDAPAELQAAQHDAAAHRAAAAQAQAKARQDAAKAALLAEQQVQQAARLRQLEDQTGDATAALDTLQAQSDAAQQTLAVSEAALTEMLPLMQRLAAQPAATLFANPDTPANSIRGLLIMQGISAEIESRAQAVKAQASQAAALLQKTRAQQEVLAAAAARQQTAEDALTAQITAAQTAETQDNDAAARETAAAITANRNIHDLQTVMNNLLASQKAAAPQTASLSFNGGLAPVSGPIVQNFGAPTLAGPAQGVTYQAPAGARVVAPCAGTVLFADHFQSYGKLVILDCGGNYDVVLAGMDRLDVLAAQKLARGQPVGQMLRYDAGRPGRQPNLYVELRRNGGPVNPAAWLTGGSG